MWKFKKIDRYSVDKPIHMINACPSITTNIENDQL